MSENAIPEPCEFCGSFTCSFVKHYPGNLSARKEAAIQALEFQAGIRKAKPETANHIASERLYQSTL